ncbi:hypothetical protein J4453_01150 [Candidatus Woesearchaeota archaeon]|nr:hypothetical protein [Candidatus Woesearchaeota archaeon]
MKHTPSVTLMLLGLFFLTQLVGLGTVNKYIQITTVPETGEVVIEHADTILGPQPVVEEKSFSFVPIVIAVLIGTGILLLLIRFGLGKFWKAWFFLGVWATLALSFEVYIPQLIAAVLGLVLALIKVFKPNAFVHNFTEIFIYTGIAIIVLPFLNVLSASVLLILISLYDMYAVWKSKHMVKMAKFQTDSKVFAGLMLRYKGKVKESPEKKGGPLKSAILGGGDMAFPLMFSAAVMEDLILNQGLAKSAAFLESLIISVLVTVALAFLFWKGQKNKFYPAMPFLSAGCFVGLGIVWLINLA